MKSAYILLLILFLSGVILCVAGFYLALGLYASFFAASFFSFVAFILMARGIVNG